jgi:cell wall-associated NlpC family hydrolase
MIQTQDLISQAREWMGVRFLHQGRTRFGCDCLGFIAGVLHELGSEVLLDNLPRAYGRNPQALLKAGLGGLTHELTSLEAGALIVVQFPQAKYASHAALYTGESIIHQFESVGKVTEHGYRGAWVKQSDSVWALPLVVYA